MNKGKRFLAGMGTGAALGMAAVLGVRMMTKKKKKNSIVRTANKAVKSMRNIMDNIQDMLD